MVIQAGGSLLKHRDEDLSWGIGVSLGSAAVFDCLPTKGKSALGHDKRALGISVDELQKLVAKSGGKSRKK